MNRPLTVIAITLAIFGFTACDPIPDMVEQIITSGVTDCTGTSDCPVSTTPQGQPPAPCDDFTDGTCLPEGDCAGSADCGLQETVVSSLPAQNDCAMEAGACVTVLSTVP
jgi:hypothetical protein